MDIISIRGGSRASADFKTQMHYARCMTGVVHGMTIDVTADMSVGVNESEVKRYIKLSNLTSKSLRGDVDGCKDDMEYSRVVAPWFSVKCYYRVYYLEAVLIHLVSGVVKPFGNGGHRYVRNVMRTYCKNGYITTSLGHAEVVESYINAGKHRLVSGANLRTEYYKTEGCVKSLRLKLVRYATDNWKKNSTHKAFRSADAKADLEAFMTRGEVSLLDFFYYMRIKANYRDADFLDLKKASDDDVFRYVSRMSAATDRYCDALEVAISRLMIDRGITL